MVIVAGHIIVDPQQRESYLASSVSVVESARRAPGCLDFAISADLIDAGRINIFAPRPSPQCPYPAPSARSSTPAAPPRLSPHSPHPAS